jgi:hypothetical protein
MESISVLIGVSLHGRYLRSPVMYLEKSEQTSRMVVGKPHHSWASAVVHLRPML